MNRAKLQRVVAANPHFTATRKMSLYSNFARLEELNPDGYEANVAAWKEVLQDALAAGAFPDATCVEAGPELVAGLNDRENGMPLALNTVFDRMVADGTLVPLPRFQAAYPSTPPSGFVSRTARLLGWAAGLVHRPQWRSGAAETLRHEKYVDMAAVSAAAARVARVLDEAVAREGSSRLAHVFSPAQVAQLAQQDAAQQDAAQQDADVNAAAPLSATDLECSLAYAAATGKLYFDATSGVVKLRRSGPITDTDATIVSLRAQIRELAAREEQLGRQVDELAAGARRAVKTNRQAAKQLLQKKALAEKSFESAAALGSQLQAVLHKIDDASDNQQAVAALDASSRVLAELNRGTSIDDVDAVMESVQDEIEQADSVSQSLAELRISPDAASTELDELEIDNELGEMEADARAQKLADTLPAAPQHKPAQNAAINEPGTNKASTNGSNQASTNEASTNEGSTNEADPSTNEPEAAEAEEEERRESALNA